MRRKRTILILLVLIFLIQVGCHYYHPFRIKNLQGNEARVIRLLENGNYLVTGGYPKLCKKLLKKEYPNESNDYYEMKARHFLVAEYLDGTCEVKAQMVEKVKELSQK